MSNQHEEFEVGHELDRAMRAAATGLGQIMERWARRSQDQARENASRAREDWLAQRDAARTKFMPWVSEGRLEKLDSYSASRKWAAAAAWSGMDPAARIAEQDFARRIMETHGQHPSILLQRTDPRTLTPDPNPPAKLLSMNEAFGLAAEHAPSWYAIPAEIKPLEEDRQPGNPLEERFHSDWQHYSENGTLPEETKYEHWANHVGRGEEFTTEKWLNAEGVLDTEARTAAMAAVWNEGREARTGGEINDHEARMHDAGMGNLDDQLSDQASTGEVAQNHTWHAYLTPSRFDAASPEDLSRAWRDARMAGLTGDLGAQKSAQRIETMMRERRGLDPSAMLTDALAEQAAQNTEARRNAEDRARRSQEAARSAGPTVTATPVDAQDSSLSSSASEVVQGEIVAGELVPGEVEPDATRRDIVDGEIVPTPPSEDLRPTTPGIRRERVIELNNMAADFYASNLRPGGPGHRYFNDRLGPEFESGPWKLGYAQPGWQNLCNHLRANGATDAELLEAGLAENGKYGVRDVFRDRAMMGVRDHETGELVGFLGRDLSGESWAPKVRNTGETPAFRKGDHVFGLYEAEPGARLVRVEGPFDAMATTLASEGKAAGVTPMGTQMTDTQAAAIVAKANGRIWTANDVDDAGQKATESDFYQLSAKGADVRQVLIPGSDPAEAWKERPALLQQQLADLPNAPTAAETVVDRYLANPEATPKGFEDLMKSISPYIDPIDRDLLSVRVAELDRARADREAVAANESTVRGDYDQVLGDLEDERRTQSADRLDGAGDTGVTDAGDGNDRLEQLEADAANTERELHRREGMTDDAEAIERDAQVNADRAVEAYDRRDEADRENISPDARAARDGSSHGFSQSTKDQVENAPVRAKGTPAKVQRGQGTKQTAGRKLRR